MNKPDAKIGTFNVYMIPESLQHLLAEIAYHPDLMAIVRTKPSFEAIIEETATYCNIAVQGRYVLNDVCKRLEGALKNKRAGSESKIILLN